ncbi:unnamed protein product [Mytilus coruscus]|uniref:CCHC-type domain-containing protein n=1 Tax=Mytilus coruscus TaxID=42192 RepID=A0A6J8B7R0_MYTCO|nr:unnamed protein product [Mytilus coruscus]
MASGKTIGARTQGRPQPAPIDIIKTIGTRTQGRPQPAPMEIGKIIGARTQGRPQPVPMEIVNPSKGRYNQGYTPVPPEGVTARESYGQQVYPVAYNEDRPRENTKGPDSRAVTPLCKGIENKELGVQVSNLQPQSIEEVVDKIRLFQHNTQAINGKTIRREVRQLMRWRYEDHPEAYHEYQVPHERTTMAPERAPASAWKTELEKTDRKFYLVHEKLDDIMDQFKKLTGQTSRGGRLPPLWGEGHFKTECPKFGGKSVSGCLSPHRGPPWEGVCYHCFKPGHVRKDCLDFQGRDKTFRDQSSRTATGPLNFNGTTQEAGVSPRK